MLLSYAVGICAECGSTYEVCYRRYRISRPYNQKCHTNIFINESLVPASRVQQHFLDYGLVSKDPVRLKCWLVGFNGISTSIGYLMPKPVYTYYMYGL